MAGGNYQEASTALDHNRLLKKNRNRLLYLLEKGKLSHLMQQYEASNLYFNEADLIMESSVYTAKDLLAGNLMNPMHEKYRGEDFEKYMVHYYKALNYLHLGQPAEALVEAKRINLRIYAQEDETRNDNHYSKDAFSLMLQGMIYEKNREWNDAFIAYRNAADLYLDCDNNFYGTSLPKQLKKDLLRMAAVNGFTAEAAYYAQLFGESLNSDSVVSEGELVIFWENGLAPVKKAQHVNFTLSKDGEGDLFFIDESGSFHVPFDFSAGVNRDDERLGDLQFLSIALPKYVAQPLFYEDASIQVNGQSFIPEQAQNINELAFATLRERWLKELSKTLTRLAIKKLAQAATNALAEKEEEKNKTREKKKYTAGSVAAGLQIFHLVSEKADTRNWQSLPHSIYFTRVPLKKGLNEVSIKVQSPSGKSKTFDLAIQNSGGLQFYSLCTLNY
jgi:hypothetical protein